jgi:hypothetical protein
LDFRYDNAAAERAIREAGTPDALSDVLTRLNDLIPALLKPEVYGRKLHAHGLDATVPQIAARLGLKDVAREKSNDNVCVVATRFYRTGGHTPVADDIMQAMGGDNTTLIYTDIFKQFRYPTEGDLQLSTASHPRRAWLILTAATLAEKIVELYALLCAIRPTRIFLIGNHMDMVAVAGCWPFRSVVDFIHHADCMPALGATLPFSAHVDLTFGCHLACREAGLDPIYASMKPPRSQAAPRAAPADHPGLTLATCGHHHKYERPARHRWADFAVAALRTSGARMIHVGPTTEALVAGVHGALEAAGIDPGRYDFIGPAPLREILVSRGVDIYVSSYPEHGGRANLEAMVAGLPCVAPSGDENGVLLLDRYPLPQFLPVREPDELTALLARAPELKAMAASAEAAAALATETHRFDDYLAGRPLPPVDPDLRL